PADEAVNRVSLRWLRDRQLLRLICEGIAALIDPIRPREHGNAARASDELLGGEAIHECLPRDGEGAKRCTHLRDHRFPVSVPDRELLARRQEGRRTKRPRSCPLLVTFRRHPPTFFALYHRSAPSRDAIIIY